MAQKKVKALGLLSGGLDSILACCVLMEQGIDVTGISFVTPFFGAQKAEIAAGYLKIPLIIKDITEDYLPILKNPPHGYGKNMNPCIDCHAFMVKTALKIMKEDNMDCIFTGEVLNERPMSQNKQALGIVSQDSGAAGYLLRPLSALLLPETEPETDGRIDRSRLLDLQGRGRKRQIELARQYEIVDYPSPAGGCLLTERKFSEKLRDLLSSEKPLKRSDYDLLRVGRHFRLNKKIKLIVGRNHEENTILSTYSGKYTLLQARSVVGPVCVLSEPPSPQEKELAGSICSRYSDAVTTPVQIEFNYPNSQQEILEITSILRNNEIDTYRI